MIPADKRIERLTQVARMYYEQNMNQSEIAKAIGVSRPLVSVLLAEARECGIVTITKMCIRDRPMPMPFKNELFCIFFALRFLTSPLLCPGRRIIFAPALRLCYTSLLLI